MRSRSGERSGGQSGDSESHAGTDAAAGDDRRRIAMQRRWIQRKARSAQAPAGDVRAPETSAGGRELPSGLRQKFEHATGSDLGGVRVHADGEAAAEARALDARAFTVGQDIHFAEGELAPHSPRGEALLAHEVAHTVQQSRAGTAAAQRKGKVSEPGDALEMDADRAAEAMVAGRGASIAGGDGGIMRTPADGHNSAAENPAAAPDGVEGGHAAPDGGEGGHAAPGPGAGHGAHEAHEGGGVSGNIDIDLGEIGLPTIESKYFSVQAKISARARTNMNGQHARAGGNLGGQANVSGGALGLHGGDQPGPSEEEHGTELTTHVGEHGAGVGEEGAITSHLQQLLHGVPGHPHDVIEGGVGHHGGEGRVGLDFDLGQTLGGLHHFGVGFNLVSMGSEAGHPLQMHFATLQLTDLLDVADLQLAMPEGTISVHLQGQLQLELQPNWAAIGAELLERFGVRIANVALDSAGGGVAAGGAAGGTGAGAGGGAGAGAGGDAAMVGGGGAGVEAAGTVGFPLAFAGAMGYMVLRTAMRADLVRDAAGASQRELFSFCAAYADALVGESGGNRGPMAAEGHAAAEHFFQQHEAAGQTRQQVQAAAQHQGYEAAYREIYRLIAPFFLLQLIPLASDYDFEVAMVRTAIDEVAYGMYGYQQLAG